MSYAAEKALDNLRTQLKSNDKIVIKLMLKLLDYGESPTSQLMWEARREFYSWEVAKRVSEMTCHVDDTGWCKVHDRNSRDCRELRDK